MTKRRTPEEIEKELGPDGRKRLEEATDLIGELVDGMLPEGASFEEYEDAVLKIANEIARRRLERKLQGIADAQPVRLHIEHNDDWHGIGFGYFSKGEFRQHLPGTVTYHSLVGPLRVRRFTYREPFRYGATYVALDLEAGLMERMTPGFARCVAFAFSQMPIREAELMLLAAGRIPPSRATLDRGAKDLGEYAYACSDEIEPVLRANEILPEGTVAVALGLDRTAVAMRGTYDPYSTGRWRPRPKGERSSGKGVSWCLDYVGTVTFLDAHGERLDSRHYRLASTSEPEHIAKRMLADVRRALEQSPRLKILIVQDGAPELWNVMRDKLKSEPSVKRWDEVLDWYHVDERLSALLDLSTAETRQRTEKRSQWHAMLLKKSDGPKAFLRSLHRFRNRIRPEGIEKFDEHVSYFTKRTALLGYRRIRRKHLPIGSGPTEGSCKSLIGTRAKRSGQHWTQRGLTSALHLREIEQSGRFDAFWTLFAERYKAPVIFAS
jgi:hypothetical protein